MSLITDLSHPIPVLLRVDQLILQLLQLLAQLVVIRVVGLLVVVVGALGVGVGHPEEHNGVIVVVGRVLDSLHQVLGLDLFPVKGCLGLECKDQSLLMRLREFIHVPRVSLIMLFLSVPMNVFRFITYLINDRLKALNGVP